MGIAMRIRTLGILLLLVCTFGTSAGAVEQTAVKNTSINLGGTTWSGIDSDGDEYTFTFKKDGTLSYTSEKDSSDKGTWKQYRHAVSYEANNRFVEAIGEISDGMIEGRSWNVKSHSWSWKLTRVN